MLNIIHIYMHSKIYAYTYNNSAGSSIRNKNVSLFWLSYFSEHTPSNSQDLYQITFNI